MTMGDRVAVMRDGRLEQCDRPQRLYDSPANLFVACFIGSPAMNVVRTTLREHEHGLAVEIGGATIALGPKLLERSPQLRDHVGREVVVGIRPEHFEDAALVAHANGSCVDVDCALAEPMGAELIAHVSLDGVDAEPQELTPLGTPATLTARLSAQSSARAGGRLRLAVEVDKLHFFDAETEEAIV
jgi:multiple sugar transport system ATP-binding protein